MTTHEIETQLAAIQSQHTGKAPFGPLDDLEDLYVRLSAEERLVLIRLLKERSDDVFWEFFVTEFKKAHPN